MPKKVYAVKNGRQTGIYHSWSEAKAQVDGFSGAQFKSFSNTESASDYMGDSGSSSSYGSGAGYGSYGGYSYSSIHSPGPTRDSSSSRSSRPPRSSSKPEQEIYVDGSSLSNGKSGARAGWGMYFGEGDSRNSSGSVRGEQTNNRAELTAIQRALDHVDDKDTSYVIHTDSQYSLSAVNTWGESWEKNDWKLSSTGEQVKNQDLIKGIRTTMKDLQSQGYDVELSKVKGHADIHGNEQADSLARAGAGQS